MPRHIISPTVITAQGNKPKLIEEYIGRVNTKTEGISLARMNSPAGWKEPGQEPEFDEYTLVLRGMIRVTTRNSIIDVKAGEAIHVGRDEWVQYSTPEDGGADYVAVCIPAFSPETVHRDSDEVAK